MVTVKLPQVGDDWIHNCTDKYIIVSLKHSSRDEMYFWLPSSFGYTPFPFNAGRYDKSEIEARPLYFNDGLANVAIPLTATALRLIGFPVRSDLTNEIFDRFCNIRVGDSEEG